MIEKLIMLQTFATAGDGGFGAILDTLERIGAFQFLLPFLIIFSLVFLTLNGLKLFKDNRAITAIIALSVGFLALSFDFVPIFFQELFPRLGVGLGIILGLLIITGLFLPQDSPAVTYTLGAIALIIGIIVFFNTAAVADWNFGTAWEEFSSEIVAWIAIIAMLVAVVAASKTAKPPNPLTALFGPQKP